jgi:hypothetical protein
LKEKIKNENGILKLEDISENSIMRLLDAHNFVVDKAYDGLIFAENSMNEICPWGGNGREDYKQIIDMKLICFLGRDKTGH